jgi:phosphatidylserine/phosphatidylglycerophosphate/cardiolipin synthase-like enzyme
MAERTLPVHRRGTPWLFVALLAAMIGAIACAFVLVRQSPPENPRPPLAAMATVVVSPEAQSGITGIFIQPGDGRRPILDEIDAATQSIDLEIYIVSDDEILTALESAQARGVAVRVLLEEHPYGGGGGQQGIFDRLQAAGIDVRWSNPAFRFSHIKMMVIDQELVIIMNQNLTTSSFTGNRELGVVTTNPDAVGAASAIFAADWAQEAEPPPGPLVVSPTNARESLQSLIEGAQTSVDVYAEVLRDPDLLQALEAAAQRGVTVRVIISPSASFDSERASLADAGVQVRLLRSLYVHAKMIMVDGRRAFVGSQNISTTSLDQNRELGIIVSDPVSLARLSRVFDIDFAAATPQEAP